MQIMEDDELHSIIQLGWDVYLSKVASMEALTGEPSNSIAPYDFYSRINEGIRSSIEAYFARP